MALSFSQLFPPTVVGTTETTLYTVPSDPATTIARNIRVRFANPTASAVTITAWAVPASGTAANGNIALPAVSIPAADYLDVQIPVLSAGNTLQAKAGSATAITATCLDGFTQS